MTNAKVPDSPSPTVPQDEWGTYAPFDQPEKLGPPPWKNNDALDAWIANHGHDPRLKCYVEFGCQAIEADLERQLSAAKAELLRVKAAYGRESMELEEILAPLAGYEYDQEYGWVVGDHTNVSLAMEIARHYQDCSCSDDSAAASTGYRRPSWLPTSVHVAVDIPGEAISIFDPFPMIGENGLVHHAEFIDGLSHCLPDCPACAPDDLLEPIWTAVETGAKMFLIVNPDDYWMNFSALHETGDRDGGVELRAHPGIEVGMMALTLEGSEQLEGSFIPGLRDHIRAVPGSSE